MRYALGVGIGTPIVVLLWRTYRDTLSPSISIASPFSGTVAALFWAAAGTAYCYVASVPMLTLHSTRVILPRTKPWVITCFVALVAALVTSVVWDLFLISHRCVLESTGIVALALVASSQLVLLWKVLRNPDETHRFYDQLSKQRANRADYVESYRHMREHGNAVSIVVLELLLAFILWSLRPVGSAGGNMVPVGRVGIVLAVWLTPSTLVWLIGSSLERYLSRSQFVDRTH
jgi:hypothetical protein